MQSSAGGTARETPGAVLTRTVPKALSQCGGVHHAIIFLDMTQLLAERAQGFPGIGHFPSLFVRLLIQEGSQSVEERACFLLPYQRGCIPFEFSYVISDIIELYPILGSEVPTVTETSSLCLLYTHQTVENIIPSCSPLHSFKSSIFTCPIVRV